MRFRGLTALLALALVFGAGTDLKAQTGYVEGFGGVLIIDDGGFDDVPNLEVNIDPALLVGGLLGYAIAPRWEIAAAYAYSPATVEIVEGGTVEEGDADVHAYFGAVNYLFPMESATFLLTGGIGGLTVSPDEEGVDSSNDLLVNFGAGLRYMATDRIALQGVVRDHVQFCSGLDEDSFDEASLCPLDDTALHHIEITGGVLVLF